LTVALGARDQLPPPPTTGGAERLRSLLLVLFP
jgi:hypothetical protein